MAGFDEHARAGMQALEQQRFDDAVREFTAAVAGAPDRPDIRHALGMAYLHRGEIGSAIPHFEQALVLADAYTAPEHEPLKLDFQLTLATAYQMTDRVAEAEDAMRFAVQRWPNAPEPSVNLAALLLTSCRVQEGIRVYRRMLDQPGLLGDESRAATEALLGSIEVVLNDEDVQASIFLEAHQASYVEYFTEVAREQLQEGWYAEAARMARPETPGGAPRPYLAEGARPYAFNRADLVDPKTGQAAQVYSDTEPMIVAVQGVEPLAQAPILLPWTGWPFEVWVSTQCPWHWLRLTVQVREPAHPAFADAIDQVIGSWYLMGYNGDFGDRESGRFHYITDPDPVGTRAISYAIDLGRARIDAIHTLMARLVVLHDSFPLDRVLLGNGRLPPDPDPGATA